MKRFLTIALASSLLGGCANTIPERQVDQVRAGMTRDEVQTLVGAPISSTHAPGQDCGTYTVMKSFWRRVPWSLTERYEICYVDNRVDRFTRESQPEF